MPKRYNVNAIATAACIICWREMVIPIADVVDVAHRDTISSSECPTCGSKMYIALTITALKPYFMPIHKPRGGKRVKQK